MAALAAIPGGVGTQAGGGTSEGVGELEQQRLQRLRDEQRVEAAAEGTEGREWDGDSMSKDIVKVKGMENRRR